MTLTFSREDFRLRCDELSSSDADLANIIRLHGYPPFWSRPPNFATLVHIILEQQVSLASARAAIDHLRKRIRRITVENVLSLSDSELKDCYFSRQKIIYVRDLALRIKEGRLLLAQMNQCSDASIRQMLTQVKGIGDWTTDIYLLMALHRSDIFPLGDLAMVKSIRKVKKLETGCSPEAMLEIAAKWQPWRSVATMLLWHHYLMERKRKL